MATAEEILAQMTAVAETEAVCMIDPETRTISIPADFALLGVESDEKAERIKFRCPRVVGDNLDLTKFGIRINYRNASGEKDGYAVDDVKIDGEDIIFSWQLDRKVTKYKGDVNFIVCAVKGAENEWNTTLATAKVLEGLETEISGSEEDKTLLEQLIAITNQKLTEMSLALTEAKKQTEKTEQATKNAETATKNAQDAAQAVFEQQYILTSETRFIGEAAAEPSGEGAAIIKNLPGGIKQDKTNGYQLFDASKFPTKTAGGATVTNNGDGSFTISGSGNLNEDFRMEYSLSHEETIAFLKQGNINAYFGDIVYPRLELILKITGKELINLKKSAAYSTGVVTKEILSHSDLTFRAVFYGASGEPIRTGTIKPMLYQDGDGTWEPYTGAEPSPNPDYPQAIKCIGENGWFDGEFRNGFYRIVDGSYTATGDVKDKYVCNKRKIACGQGDTCEVICEKEATEIYFIYYDKEGAFIKASTLYANVKNARDVAPERTAYMNFDISVGDGITSENTVGNVTVLKNGKYAIIVKTRGKNLFNKDSNDVVYGATSHAVKNNEITVTIKASNYNPVAIYILGKIEDYKGKTLHFRCDEIEKSKTEMNPKISIRLSKQSPGSVATIKTIKEVAEPMVWGVAEIPVDTGEANVLSCCLYANSGRDVGVGAYAKFKNVIVAESQVESYEPYKESITYIPLDSPLYEGDKIYLEDGELWEYRENERVILDEKYDDYWMYTITSNSNICNPYNTKFSQDNRYVKRSLIKCNISMSQVKESSGEISASIDNNAFISKNSYLNFMWDISRGFDSVDKWKTFVSENPVEVVCKLATPTRKKLGSAEAFNLRTFDERTYIEVAGSEELGTENTFIVPRNQSGGLMTDAFATAKRNAIQVAEQANLASRISALEQLAVKESV